MNLCSILVSAVRGELRPECSPLDLLAAAFPGGSITGAPKIRAMEIIAELEPTARGAYCGSLGYLGFDGSSGHQHSDSHDHREPAAGCKRRWAAASWRNRSPSANTKKPGTKPKGLLRALKT